MRRSLGRSHGVWPRDADAYPVLAVLDPQPGSCLPSEVDARHAPERRV